MNKKAFSLVLFLIVSGFIHLSQVQGQFQDLDDQGLFYEVKWQVDYEEVEVVNKFDEVHLSVTLTGMSTGFYRVRLMRARQGEDMVVESDEDDYTSTWGPVFFSFTFTFEASIASGERGTIGYYADVYQQDYDGHRHVWVEKWTMPDQYPPRLKVNPWRIETIISDPVESCLDLDSNNYPHLIHSAGIGRSHMKWNGTHWEKDVIRGRGEGVDGWRDISPPSTYSLSFTLDFEENPHLIFTLPGGMSTPAQLWHTTLVDSDWDFNLIDSRDRLDILECQKLVIDSNNIPHIVYRWYEYDGPGRNLIRHLVYYSQLYPDYPETIGFGDSITIDLDTSDTPHLVVDRGQRSLPGYLQYYIRTDSDSWGIPDNPDLTMGGGVFGKISFALDSDNRPQICYYDENDEALKYVAETESGWSSPITLDSHGSGNSIAIDDSNNPHIVYIDSVNEALKYIKYTTDGWSIPMIVDSGIDFSGSPSIAIDSNNHVHIVYGGEMENGEWALRYATTSPVPPVYLDVNAVDSEGNFMVTINAGDVKEAPVSSVELVSEDNIESYRVTFADEFMVVIVEGVLQDSAQPGQLVLEIDPVDTIITYELNISPQESTNLWTDFTIVIVAIVVFSGFGYFAYRKWAIPKKN